MIKKVLVANRGEIACRIIKTLSRLGIESSVVFSREDEGSLAVEMADKSFLLKDPENKSQEYLDINQIIKIAKQNGIDAVHPGYGFLSENASFAKDIEKNGIKFIGPPAKAIEIMGDKITSKLQAKNCGVSTIPGVDEEILNLTDAQKVVEKIEFPIMVKASAGGGGKGMRVVRSLEELADSFHSAKNEARSSFGDDRIFIEKFVEKPHHIEIQILGDQLGNFIHLGERDCSIQRRNQKIIEECPSPFINDHIRNAMAAQAIELARSVNYFSAGTVEFIVDSQKNFYFLEMNTRLQVEHPVTELTTGVDIVEEMINIASGKKLELKQRDIALKGSALEARIYAEDPSKDFMPSVGRLTRYIPPKEYVSDNKVIRNDTGVFEGSNISYKYDPMISKLCVWTPTREQSIRMLHNALAEFCIDGIKNNLGFLSDVISKSEFKKGEFTTNFLADQYPDGIGDHNLNDEDSGCLAAAGLALSRFSELNKELEEISELDKGDQHIESYSVHLNEMSLTFSWYFKDGLHVITSHEKKEYLVELNSINYAGFTKVKVNSRVMRLWLSKETDGFSIKWNGYQSKLKVFTPFVSKMLDFLPSKRELPSSPILMSPMPGLLVDLDVGVGDKVQLGQRLCTLEAMKMENVLYAERAGKIKQVYRKKGDILSDGDKILEYE